jgi:hypothetical protein
MMPLKYLKDFDCWNLLSLVAHGRLEDVMRLDIQQFRRDKCA